MISVFYMVKLTYIDVIRDHAQKEGASLEKEMMENFKKSATIMPFVGLFVSLLLYVYFFGITGVEGSIWVTLCIVLCPFGVHDILFADKYLFFGQ